MTDTRRILAGICAFLFVVSGFVAILLVNVERKTFSSETYKQAFKQQGLYDDAAGLFTGAVMTYAQESGSMLGLVSVLDRAELEVVISALLPPAELEAVTDEFLDSVFAYLNMQSDSVTLSLRPIKQNLIGEGGGRAISQILQAQPDCTAEQLLQMGMDALSANQGMSLCKPPEEFMGLVTPLAEAQLQVVSRSLPDDLPVIAAGQGEDFRPRLNKVRTVMKLSLLLPLAFLLAITFLVVRSLADWLKWWGIPILVTGILVTLTAMLAVPLTSPLVDYLIAQNGLTMPVVFSELVRDLTGSLTREIFRPVAIQGIALIILGGVMMVVKVVAYRNE